MDTSTLVLESRRCSSIKFRQVRLQLEESLLVKQDFEPRNMLSLSDAFVVFS